MTRRHPYDHLGSVMNEVKVRQKVPSSDPDNRPPIDEGLEMTDRDYCGLIRECWDADPQKRPSAEKVIRRNNKSFQIFNIFFYFLSVRSLWMCLMWLCDVVVLMCGCVDMWMCGCVDVWMCGCVDMWMCGYVDVWMCGCVDMV